MNNGDFIPKNYDELSSWAKTLKTGFTPAANALGLTGEDINEVNAACDSIVAKVQQLNDTETAYHAAVKQAEEMTDNDKKTLRNIAASLKTKKGYTDAIGKSLGLVGTSVVMDFSNYTASIAAHVEGNMVRIRFKKSGVDYVNIYRRLKGTADWTFVARYTHSPYDDHITLETPGQPEHLEYTAYGVKDDKEVGSPAAIQQVVFGVTA